MRYIAYNLFDVQNSRCRIKIKKTFLQGGYYDKRDLLFLVFFFNFIYKISIIVLQFVEVYEVTLAFIGDWLCKGYPKSYLNILDYIDTDYVFWKAS